MGQFTPSQIINGAILTCDSVTPPNPSDDAFCQGPMLNGMPVRGSDDSAENVAICKAVTGNGALDVWGGGGGDASLKRVFGWNGSTWVLSNDYQTIGFLYCHQP